MIWKHVSKLRDTLLVVWDEVVAMLIYLKRLMPWFVIAISLCLPTYYNAPLNKLWLRMNAKEIIIKLKVCRQLYAYAYNN